jgi:hypothetical protein
MKMLKGPSVIAATTLLFGLIGCSGVQEDPQQRRPPIASGDYKFAVKDAEFDGRMPSGEVTVKIRRRHIEVFSSHRASVFPDGLVEEGELLWHARSGQWIIGSSAADAAALDVGGCGGGPTVIDLQKGIYWMC